MDPLVLFIIFCVGVLASFIGAIVGGGGLITIPVLVFLGLPPVGAIATSRFAGIGLVTTISAKYWKAKKVVTRLVLPLCIVRILGATLGSTIVIGVDPTLLNKIMGVALLVLGFFVVKKESLGIKQGKEHWIAWPLMLLSGFWGGFFSGGIGIINMFVLTSFLGLTFLKSNGTSAFSGIPARVMSIAIFAYAGVIDYTAGIVLLAGMAVGGWLGATTAIKKGNAWIKRLFIAMIVVSATKLLFFS